MRGGKTGGRKRGTPNKVTRSCREAIEHAADVLGGAERLAAWARSSAENERTFWASIYPKLLPLPVPLSLSGGLVMQQREQTSERERLAQILDENVANADVPRPLGASVTLNRAACSTPMASGSH